MKKLLILVVCCLCLCGCGNDFKTSKIKTNTIKSFNDVDTVVSGSIKNNSTKTCDALRVVIEFKSNTLITDENINIITSNFKSGDIINFEEVIHHKDYDGYTAKFKNIECSESLNTN